MPYAAPLLGFALTLMLQATVLLGAAWLLERFGVLRRAGHVEFAWRIALLGAVVAATLTSLPWDRVGTSWPQAAAQAVTMRAAPMGERHVLPAVVAPRREQYSSASDSRRYNELKLPTSVIAWTAQVWAAGALALLLLTAWRSLGVYRLMHRTRRAQIVLPECRENEIAGEVAAHYGLDTPDLRFGEALASPVVLPGGAVLLPRWASTLPAEQLRALLAHELAHLARRDPFWRMLHHLALAPLFAHPLAWRALRRLDGLAEHEADAMAARLLGDGRPLAECLALFLEQSFPSRPAPPRFALAMAERPGAIVRRVQRLLEEDPMSHVPPSRAFTRSGLALGLLAALALPSLMVTAIARGASGSSVSIQSDSEGESMTVKVRENGYGLDVDMRGDITFADDESDVVAMSPDAQLDIEETRDGVERTIEFTLSASGLQRKYEVDGQARAFDAQAQVWLAKTLPDIFRRSGVDAEARAARILKARGADGLLDEIASIEGDYGRGTYLGQLFAHAKLDAAQQRRALELTRAIDSDYELRRALGTALSSGNITPGMQSTVLDLAGDITSDYERAELLIQALAAFQIDGPMFERWSQAVEEIHSDYEHRRVLDAMLQRCGDNPQAVRIVLRAAAAIGSDYERRQLLEAGAGRALANPRLRRGYLDAAAGIHSDYERKQALLTLLRSGPVDADLAIAVMGVIDGIGSDHETMEALVALADSMPADARVIERYRQSARRLSDY